MINQWFSTWISGTLCHTSYIIQPFLSQRVVFGESMQWWSDCHIRKQCTIYIILYIHTVFIWLGYNNQRWTAYELPHWGVARRYVAHPTLVLPNQKLTLGMHIDFFENDFIGRQWSDVTACARWRVAGHWSSPALLTCDQWRALSKAIFDCKLSADALKKNGVTKTTRIFIDELPKHVKNSKNMI